MLFKQKKPASEIIISVHLPKTAGISFNKSLEQYYTGSIFHDYTDLPMNSTKFERNNSSIRASIKNLRKDYQGTKCIHGHFLPIKYLLLANKINLKFITWMRHPAERIISHYFFWKKPYNPTPPKHSGKK
jgi:hypothetical protein